MNPYIHIDDAIAEVGGAFTGHVTYEPEPGGAERVRGLVLQLTWRTDGRGDPDGAELEEVRIPASADGRIDGAWSVPIPATGPISYHGRLMAIGWTLTAKLDIRRRVDPDWSVDVVVVPGNGRPHYVGPHPLAPGTL